MSNRPFSARPKPPPSSEIRLGRAAAANHGGAALSALRRHANRFVAEWRHRPSLGHLAGSAATTAGAYPGGEDGTDLYAERRKARKRLSGLVAALLVAAWIFPALAAAQVSGNELFDQRRDRMVSEQLERRNIVQPEVLSAMREVPRHQFVPSTDQDQAYEDHPVRIGHDQTISQPYIVALMTQLLELDPDDRVLEVGTGSGYHAAVLSRVASEVFTVEILEPLGLEAQRRLRKLGYENIEVRIGDGHDGWPEKAPFDAIILTAAPPEPPQSLLEQLKMGGRMVLPVGRRGLQALQVLTRTEHGIVKEDITAVRFVPMTGRAKKNGE